MVRPTADAHASAISSGVKTRVARRPARGSGTGRDRTRSKREVDGLPPRGGADLEAGDVHLLEVAVLHQQVGQLDVAVGDADVPEGPDHGQALVDDDVVDLGVTEVRGVRRTR